MFLKKLHLLYIVSAIAAVLTGCLVNDDGAELNASPTAEFQPLPKPLVSAYLHIGNRKLNLNMLKLDGVDILNLAFTKITNSHMGLLNPSDANNFMVARSLKKVYPQMKIIVSVGGYGTAKDFSRLCVDPEKRAVFVNDAVRFVRYFNLDGIDVDWEFPGMDRATRDTDRVNFTALISELRLAFDKASKEDSKKYLLTIAAGAFDLYLTFTEPEKIAPLVDYFYLMTYDFYGQWNKYTGHHTNLYNSALQPGGHSVHKVVTNYIKRGIPKEKLIIGAAFYGRQWKNVEPLNNGLFRPGKGVGSISYNKIVPLMQSGKYIRYWDKKALAPMLYNPDEKIFISYEDEESVARKVGYVNIHGLGGIMYWEHFSDYNSRLANVVKREMKIIKGENPTLNFGSGFNIKKVKK